MICKKCGAELNGEYAFCPKCGNQLKKKHKAGMIIGITVPLLLLGVGIALYISGYYKNIAMRFGWISEENVVAVADSDAVNVALTDEIQQENMKNETDEETIEEVIKEPDEMEIFLENLILEPVEMSMGETYRVELEREVPDGIWSSSDEKVVKAAEGQLKAMLPGTATVTFSTGEKEIPFNVTVNTFSDITLAVNCSKSMEIDEIVSNVRWESSSPEIVSVEEGIISAISAGASTVTAYIDEIPYSFEVVATTPDITTTSVRKIIGNTEQVSILGTNGKVEWKSDNTAIATVSDTGLITAEPTGAGQSTVVHAYVDGMEFKIDVAVEPIPQLSSTYKMYGHQDDSTYKNAKIAICTNANETIAFTYQVSEYDKGTRKIRAEQIENVLNVADVDYSDKETYPLYHAFYSRSNDPDDENYIDIYLVGTSQTAEVLVQTLEYNYYIEFNDDGLSQADSIVTYEPCENYGIIHIYNHDYQRSAGGGKRLLVTVVVDGYQYQFVVDSPYATGAAPDGVFRYDYIDRFPADYMIEECSVDEIVVPEKTNVNYSKLQENFKTYIPDNEWLERIGTKFVEEVEDQAIEMAAGALLKMIFL